MPMMETVLTAAQIKRIERLAADAGCTVKQIMPHVLKYGLPELEQTVKKIKRGIADADAGRTVSHELVMAQLDATIKQHTNKHSCCHH